MANGLNDKQKRFAEEYLIDMNATQAAIRAGYSPKTAHVQGARLLSYANVSAYVKERQSELSAKLQLDQEWVLTHLRAVVEKSMQEVEVERWDYENKEMIGTGEYVFDSKGANRALELIGKHLGMFKDSLKLTGEMTVKIVDDIQ